MNYKIDIVVTWVDGSDPEWLKKRAPYYKNLELMQDDVGGEKRYKDTGYFKYFFRSIEKFAPWVNKVYLVTDNQKPRWLNTNNEKLIVVDHKDIINECYLPTFKSTAITLNLHKIPNLSEHFIYFNDDMFLVGPTKRKDFFSRGLPKDMAVLGIMSPSNNDMFWNIRSNLICAINQVYNTKHIKKHIFKWINLRYPFKYNVRNISLMRFGYITDFLNPHIPHSYCKSYFEKTWRLFPSICSKTMNTKFRNKNDAFEWLVRYCQLLEGHFSPSNLDKMGVVYDANDKGVSKVITSKRYKFICINNDANDINHIKIINSFNLLFPDKSSYEK